MYSLALIIFVVSEKRAFEHFPIVSNVNLCPAVVVILDFLGKHVSKRFLSETTWIIETKLPRNDHWKVLYNVYVFDVYRKSKMAATTIHRLTLDPMGTCSNAFFSETTNIIKAKLYMNVHWMVLYKLYVFCSDMKFKMAALRRRHLNIFP
jgi:hypothetical protein